MARRHVVVNVDFLRNASFGHAVIWFVIGQFLGMTAKRRLYVHIGMGRCGSTAIQSHFSKTDSRYINYISYPGEIDANPLILEYAESGRIPGSVRHAVEARPLARRFTEYIISRALLGSAPITIISAEHLSWHMDDRSLENFYEQFLGPLSRHFEVGIIAYFRQPAASRFLSTLLEDAKYSPAIRLYLPDWPYSENAEVYRRWQDLCTRHSLAWMPLLFARDALVHGDIVADFHSRIGINRLPGELAVALTAEMVNVSMHPLILSAVRRVFRGRQGSYSWDRLSELVTKLAGLAKECVRSHDIHLPVHWSFNADLERYIELVSAQERQLVFDNGSPSASASVGDQVDLLNWKGNEILAVLPSGVTYQDGCLRGELEDFIEGIHSSEVERLAALMEISILETYSYSDSLESLTGGRRG